MVTKYLVSKFSKLVGLGDQGEGKIFVYLKFDIILSKSCNLKPKDKLKISNVFASLLLLSRWKLDHILYHCAHYGVNWSHFLFQTKNTVVCNFKPTNKVTFVNLPIDMF